MTDGTLITAPAEPNTAELSQWFTPDWLARRMVAWAGLAPGSRVLEPSAGTGSIVRAGPDLQWTAVEIDLGLFNQWKPDELARLSALKLGDFLNVDPTDDTWGRFDAAIMNPPYEDGRDVAHILHALRFAPRVIALVRSAFRHTKGRWTDFWCKVDPVRCADLIGRPKFGGDNSAKYDFTCWEFRAREGVRNPGEPLTIQTEWWPKP